MYAPGIPDKKQKTSIPRAENATWELNLQEHDADKAGLHTDLRLSPPGSGKAYSWALPKGMPGTGQKHLAIRQPDHTSKYMGWSGTIEDGYGKGEVKSTFLGDVDILKAGDKKIEFNMYPGRDTRRFILLNKGGTDQ